MRLKKPEVIILLLLCTACGDVDVSETVNDEYTYALDSCYSVGNEGLVSDPDTITSSPMHVPGQRNASTVWFFHQPWAARVYWGKLIRDAVTLLVLAVLVTFFTRRKG